MRGQRRSQGFTLVEVAIVLAIAGFIMGMAFKGKAMLDVARVRSLAAQYGKIDAASVLYQDRYGFPPGDGCKLMKGIGQNAKSVLECDQARDGALSVEELEHYLPSLVQVGLLPATELKSVLGVRWRLVEDGAESYLHPSKRYLSGEVAVDGRFVCALDQQIDDGVAATGQVRSDGAYDAQEDCWTLATKLKFALAL